MATGTDAIIMDLLLQKLATLNPALPISYPGVNFPPPGQTKPESYIEVTFLPNRTITRTVGEGHQQHQGILQATVIDRPGIGLVKPLDTADRIIQHFAKGTTLDGQGVRVKIGRKPWAAAPLQTAEAVRVPVSIEYRSFNQ